MASLEDRILNGKTAGYCSSSDEDEDPLQTNPDPPTPQSTPSMRTCNTGPKGVMEDWRRYKQLCTEKRDEQHSELNQLAKRLCVDPKKDSDGTAAPSASKRSDDEFDEDDDFMKEYMRKRLQEMKAMLRRNQNGGFGDVYPLNDADDYLKAIDDDSRNGTVVIHLYEENNDDCAAMNACLRILSQRYSRVKFCKVIANTLGASERFCREGVPALQAYRNGELMGNFVRTTDHLGRQCFADDVEHYLQEYGILPDSPSIGRPSDEGFVGAAARKCRDDDDSDSD